MKVKIGVDKNGYYILSIEDNDGKRDLQLIVEGNRLDADAVVRKIAEACQKWILTD